MNNAHDNHFSPHTHSPAAPWVAHVFPILGGAMAGLLLLLWVGPWEVPPLLLLAAFGAMLLERHSNIDALTRQLPRRTARLIVILGLLALLVPLLALPLAAGVLALTTRPSTAAPGAPAPGGTQMGYVAQRRACKRTRRLFLRRMRQYQNRFAAAFPPPETLPSPTHALRATPPRGPPPVPATQAGW